MTSPQTVAAAGPSVRLPASASLSPSRLGTQPRDDAATTGNCETNERAKEKETHFETHRRNSRYLLKIQITKICRTESLKHKFVLKG